MAKRLHVGNLSYLLNSEDVLKAFQQVGEVSSAKVILDMETGRSKGFAFVEMATDEMADAAIKYMHGRELDGRQLKVSVASPKPERPEGGNRFGGKRVGGFNRGLRRNNNK